MPLKSKAQARYLFATHPKVAQEFAAATPSFARLPERKSSPPKKSKKSRKSKLEKAPPAMSR